MVLKKCMEIGKGDLPVNTGTWRVTMSVEVWHSIKEESMIIL